MGILQLIILFWYVYFVKAQICSKKNIKMQTKRNIMDLFRDIVSLKTKFKGPQAPNL